MQLRYDLKKRWRRLGFITGTVLLLAGALVLVREGGLSTADMVASVASLLVGVVSLGFTAWSARTGPSGPDEAAVLVEAMNGLAGQVRRQWDGEAGTRGLRNPYPIRVRWSATDRPVRASADAILGGRSGRDGPHRLELSGELRDVADARRGLPHRQLVVLGEPGAGKTVLALLLTLDELAARGPADPVPVLLPAAGWDPRRDHLDDWVTRFIEAEYPTLRNARHGKDVATRLVREGKVLPILDGLDEMPPRLAADAISALNDAVSGAGLILTCRSQDYEDIVTNSQTTLSRAAVIEIEPVAVEDASGYLTGAEPEASQRWRPVLRHLRRHRDGSLAGTLSTPLMISIAKVVYAPGAAGPEELLRLSRTRSVAELSQELIQRYVPSSYRDRPPAPDSRERRRYRGDQVAAWLSFLAHHQQRRFNGAPNLAWWHLALAVPAWLIGLVDGACAGTLSGLVVIAAMGASAEALFLARGAFVVVGLVVGLTAARAARTLARERSARHGIVEQVGQALRDGLLIGVVATPALAWPSTLSDSAINLPEVAFVVAVSAAVLTGIAAGLRMEKSAGPRRVVLLRRHSTRIVGRLLAGLLIGEIVGIPFAGYFTDSVPLFGGTPGTRLLLTALVAGAIGTAVIGLPLAIGKSLQTAVDEDTAVTPDSVLRADLSAFGTVAVGIGLVIGVPLAAVTIAAGGDYDGIRIGAVLGVTLGLVTAAAAVPSGVCYVAAHLCLALRGRLPWRLMRFLDDAKNREVLRLVGSVYQFRHAMLQRHFAPELSTAEQAAGSAQSRRVPAGVRTWFRRTATALPLVVLAAGVSVSTFQAWAGLRYDAMLALLHRAEEVQPTDPVGALRLRYAALRLEPGHPGIREQLLHGLLLLDGRAHESAPAVRSDALFIDATGERLATSDTGGGATIWRIGSNGDLENPTRLYRAGGTGSADGQPTTVKFSQDGRFAAGFRRDSHRVTVWRTANVVKPIFVRRLPVPSNVIDVAIRGDAVMTLAEDGAVRRQPWSSRRTRSSVLGESHRRDSSWLLSDDATLVVGDSGTTPDLVLRSLDGDRIVLPRLAEDPVGLAVGLRAGAHEIAVTSTYPGYTGIYDFRTSTWTLPATRLLGAPQDVAITGQWLVLLEEGRVTVIDRHGLLETLIAATTDFDGYLCQRITHGLTVEQWHHSVPYWWIPGLTFQDSCH